MADNSAGNFGSLLRQLRKRMGINQQELAAAVDYSVSFISSLERGARLPQLTFVSERLVHALGLQDDPRLATQLIALAARARNVQLPKNLEIPLYTQVIEIGKSEKERGSLPVPPTALIGRDAEVKTLCNRFVGHRGRLLTLLGPPGVGKTRLALELAEQLSYLRRDGASFIALSSLRNGAHLASSVAVGLGLSNVETKPPKKRLLEFLRRRELLLILDNFEQLLTNRGEQNPATSLVTTLLRECPSVCIIVTSRERLHLRAEQRYRVQPLDVDAATALFIERVQMYDATWASTHGAEATIRQICQLLDCLPLAIELAAARCDLLTPSALLASLQQRRLDLLVDGAVDLPSHQRTLRSAIEGSYALLNREEKALFCKLSIFSGGFCLDVVESLTQTPLLLESLISKSLVNSSVLDGSRRFTMLETVREFAMEQLTPTDQEEAHQKHLAYFHNLAQPTTESRESAEQIRLYTRLEQERDNIRIALGWGIQNNPTAALQLALALKDFWSIHGYSGEAAEWLHQLLSVHKQPTSNRARALLALASAERRLGNYASTAEALEEVKQIAIKRDETDLWLQFYHQSGWYFYDLHEYEPTRYHFEEGLTLARSAQNGEQIIHFLVALVHLQRDRPEHQQQITAYLEECLHLLHTQPNPQVQAFVLQQYGALEVAQQRYARATQYYEQMLRIYRKIGDKLGRAWGLELLAEAAWFQENFDTAQNYHEEAYRLFTEIDNPDGIMTVLHHLGQIARRQGRLSDANSFYTQSLGYAKMLKNRHLIARCLAGLGGVALLQSDYKQAARYMYSAKREFDALPPFLAPIDQDEFQKQYDKTIAHLDTSEQGTSWKEKNILSTEQLVSITLLQHDNQTI